MDVACKAKKSYGYGLVPGRAEGMIGAKRVLGPLARFTTGSHWCGLEGEEKLWIIWPWCLSAMQRKGQGQAWTPLKSHWCGLEGKEKLWIWPWCLGAKRVLGPFCAFHAWQTAGLNASKKPLMWPGRRRKATDMALVPERHATEGASSTPPVVPGAAPASAKAGVGGFSKIGDGPWWTLVFSIWVGLVIGGRD